VVVDSHNQPVIIALEVKDDAIRANDAGVGVRLENVRRVLPISSLSFLEPGLYSGLYRSLVLATPE
jgi:hypothetical protein